MNLSAFRFTKNSLRKVVRFFGYEIVKSNNVMHSRFPPDFEVENITIVERVCPYTITSPERIYSLVESVRYIARNDIAGSFVECGVYKGGSMMAVALALLEEDQAERELYLFDTFQGMPAPSEKDVDLWGQPAFRKFSATKISDQSSTWTKAPLEVVKENIVSTGYPMDKVKMIKGLVENTIPEEAPRTIALLRLDTDWYRSTLHELTHLYPRVTQKGITIIDDYGHYLGAKEAVKEYFRNNSSKPFLHRIDYTGRLIVKTE